MPKSKEPLSIHGFAYPANWVHRDGTSKSPVVLVQILAHRTGFRVPQYRQRREGPIDATDKDSLSSPILVVFPRATINLSIRATERNRYNGP